jgi:hypothetical protein
LYSFNNEGTIASFSQQKGNVAANFSGQDLIDRLGVTGDIQVKSSVTIGSFAFDHNTLFTFGTDVLDA